MMSAMKGTQLRGYQRPGADRPTLYLHIKIGDGDK